MKKNRVIPFVHMLLFAALVSACFPSSSNLPGAATLQEGTASTTVIPPSTQGGDVPATLPGIETTALDTSLAYLDASLPIETRVEDLLARMSLEEKIGQMTQVEKGSIIPEDITRLGIGSLLSGGGGSPTPNTVTAWADMVDGFQTYALRTRLRIPLIYGVDAVHGHGNLYGATVFPHNIGLGAANDPELTQAIGRATALEMAASGTHWNFAPVLAVPQDVRWGRTYEGYSEDPEIVTRLGTAYLVGLQGGIGLTGLSHPGSVLATPKHFVGDGATLWGSSTTDNYRIDQGDVRMDEATLRRLALLPYKAAVEAGAQSIMVSFSSWNGVKMHAQRYLLLEVLKGELGFSGFLISDWKAIDQIPGDYYSDVVTSINAGLDMIMVPYDYQTFIIETTKAVQTGDIPIDRVDDAVRRILRVKFELGLFEKPFAQRQYIDRVGSSEHRDLALQAVRKSLVLLKNEAGVLPLSTNSGTIFVAGAAADDIGSQCGGWTIFWEGRAGNITIGTSVLDGLRVLAGPGLTLEYDPFGRFNKQKDANGFPAIADVGIVVVAEPPYAEGLGDHPAPAILPSELGLIDRMRERSRYLVLVLLSGRPVILGTALDQADAIVAAWLPGTEGDGIAQALFGAGPMDEIFSGRLPYTWPRSAQQLPLGISYPSGDTPAADCSEPLFPRGYGLSLGDPSPPIPSCP